MSESAGTPSDAGTVVNVETVACIESEDCDNGVFCDGEESCMQGLCVGGQPVRCDDELPCTHDSCSETAAACVHAAPDQDGDGHADAECLDADGEPLGDDCDDADGQRFPGNPELCSVRLVGSNSQGVGDGKDEDCDPQTIGERDQDGDGYTDWQCYNLDADGMRIEGDDCNDVAPSIHPTASEVCDYFDNNCDGQADEGLRLDRYEDPDGDGFGGSDDPSAPGTVILIETSVCAGEVRVAADETDCGPNDRLVSPDRDELCDGVDNNCNGQVDEDVVPSLWYRDADRDGYGDSAGGVTSTCERIDHLGWSLFGDDCDDSNAQVNPGQAELCDGLDNDCNPATVYLIGPGNGEDDDGDGVADGACGTLRPDCVDTDATVYPGALELCDGIDNDCNGAVDTRTTVAQWYLDLDGDGFGNEAAQPLSSCEPVAGRITRGGDCDDNDAAVHPEASDDCHGIHGVDDNCSGDADEGEARVAYYTDQDGDGYGSGEPGFACATPVDYVDRGGDCNDSGVGSEAINPGAAEDCDPGATEDRNCNGDIGCGDIACHGAAACMNLFGITLVSPASPTIVVGQTTEVTVRVMNEAGTAGIVGSELIVIGDEGCLYPDEIVTTLDEGYATFTIGVGLAERAYQFRVENGASTPLTFTLHAIYPAEDIMWTLVGDRTNTHKPGPFGPQASVGTPVDMVLTPDGGAYVASVHRIYHMDPVGQVTHIAGDGNAAASGNNGPALDAGLGYANDVALDAAHGRLYFSSGATVRFVDLDAEPHTVQHFAGGGADAIPGYAPTANIGAVTDLEMAADGSLLVATATGYYAIDTGRYDIDLFLRPASNASLAPTAMPGGSLSARPDGSVWVAAAFRSLDLYNKYMTYGTTAIGLVRDGVIVRVMGQPERDSIGGLSDGFFIDDSVYQSTGASGERTILGWHGGIGHQVDSVAEGPGGNLYFVANGYDVTDSDRRIFAQNTASRFVTSYTNVNAYYSTGPYLHRQGSATRQPVALRTGPDGDLWFIDAFVGELKRIRRGGLGETDGVSLAKDEDSGDGQSLWPGQQMQRLRVTASFGRGAPPVPEGKTDLAVFADHSGSWGGVDAITLSGLDGSTRIAGRAAVEVGSHLIAAELQSLDGAAMATELFSYEVTTPPSGSVSTVVNADFIFAAAVNMYDGTRVLDRPVEEVRGVAAASDGSFYFAQPGAGNGNVPASWIARVDPEGTATRIAGRSYGSALDGVDARSASLAYPTALALDEVGGRIFLYEGGPDRVRVVDLVTGIISTVVTDVVTGIATLEELTWGPDALYGATSDGVVRITVDAPAPAVEPWLVGGDCGSAPVVFSGCGQGNYRCSVAFREDGKAYVAGTFCGSALSSSLTGGVGLFGADGQLEELLAGGGGAFLSVGELAPRQWGLDYIRGLSVAPDGRVYFADSNHHRLWELSADHTTLKVVLGDSATGGSGNADFVGDHEGRLKDPAFTTVLPDGTVLISDEGNQAIRRYWP